MRRYSSLTRILPVPVIRDPSSASEMGVTLKCSCKTSRQPWWTTRAAAQPVCHRIWRRLPQGNPRGVLSPGGDRRKPQLLPRPGLWRGWRLGSDWSDCEARNSCGPVKDSVRTMIASASANDAIRNVLGAHRWDQQESCLARRGALRRSVGRFHVMIRWFWSGRLLLGHWTQVVPFASAKARCGFVRMPSRRLDWLGGGPRKRYAIPGRARTSGSESAELRFLADLPLRVVCATDRFLDFRV
jgi:hypothetical protein